MYVLITDPEEKRGGGDAVHQSHSDLEHVVAQRKVQKAVPRSLHAFAGVLAGVQEGFAAFVETGHRDCGRLGRWGAGGSGGGKGRVLRCLGVLTRER
jgi:hypothetical protein